MEITNPFTISITPLPASCGQVALRHRVAPGLPLRWFYGSGNFFLKNDSLSAMGMPDYQTLIICPIKSYFQLMPAR
jgi:hypothetical protein